MNKKYTYNEKDNSIEVIYSPSWGEKYNTAIQDFCNDYGIDIEKFDLPVTIGSEVKSCSGLFMGCKNFNQKVVIPEGVKSCFEMFLDCHKFNQPIAIPNSVNVVYAMFRSCLSFNQAVTIPEKVTITSAMFMDCEVFNQSIIIPDNTVSCIAMFKNCKAFNQKVILPSGIIESQSMFEGCISYNQPIIIGENVQNYNMMFYGCKSLNQQIELKSSSRCDEAMFKDCVALNPENVNLYCKKIVKTSLEKKIQRLWGIEDVEEIEEYRDKINIVRVKAESKLKIEKVHCVLTDNKQYDFTYEELKKMTLEEIHKKLETIYRENKLISLEISEKSDMSMKTLCVYFDKSLFCIGAVDEWDGIDYYYDSGEGEELVDIQGNLYPKHMVSSDSNLLFLIIDEFIKSGKLTRKVKWRK